MIKTVSLRQGRRFILGSLLVLPVLASTSACVTTDGEKRTASSPNTGSSAAPGRKGVEGAVITAGDGKPIEAATIDARSLDVPAQPVPERIVLSKADGRYFWPLKPGAYELTARVEGYKSLTLPIELEPESLATLTFLLERDG